MATLMKLIVLPGTFAICRLPPDTVWPTWASGALVSATRSADEMSVVCEETAVPEGVRHEGGWRCLRVAGTLDFTLAGVLVALLLPLRDAGVSVFAVSTFDTDYLLVKDANLNRTVAALAEAGHTVNPGNG